MREIPVDMLMAVGLWDKNRGADRLQKQRVFFIKVKISQRINFYKASKYKLLYFCTFYFLILFTIIYYKELICKRKDFSFVFLTIFCQTN